MTERRGGVVVEGKEAAYSKGGIRMSARGGMGCGGHDEME